MSPSKLYNTTLPVHFITYTEEVMTIIHTPQKLHQPLFICACNLLSEYYYIVVAIVEVLVGRIKHEANISYTSH